MFIICLIKQVTDVSLVLKDSDMDSENLSSLIRLSVSDGQKTDSSKVVFSYRYIIKTHTSILSVGLFEITQGTH